MNFEKLKNLKTQIEHSQHLVEKSNVKLQKDFENWWQEQCEIIEQKNQKHEEYEHLNRKPTTAESVASSMVSSIPSGASFISNSKNSLNLNSTLNSPNSTPVTDTKYYDISNNKPRILPYLESDGYVIE